MPQIDKEYRWFGEVELNEDRDVNITKEWNGWRNWFGAHHTDDGLFSLVVCECRPAFEFIKFKLATEEDQIQFRTLNPAYVGVIDLLAAGSPLSHPHKLIKYFTIVSHHTVRYI